MYPLSSCKATIFRNDGIIIGSRCYHENILNVIQFYFNSGRNWRRQDERAAWSGKSVQLALLWCVRWSMLRMSGGCWLHYFAHYSRCYLRDLFSIYIGSKQKPQSFDLWSSLHVPHLFGNLWIALNFPLSNLQSTSFGDHQRNLTMTQVTSLMIVR